MEPDELPFELQSAGAHARTYLQWRNSHAIMAMHIENDLVRRAIKAAEALQERTSDRFALLAMLNIDVANTAHDLGLNFVHSVEWTSNGYVHDEHGEGFYLSEEGSIRERGRGGSIGTVNRFAVAPAWPTSAHHKLKVQANRTATVARFRALYPPGHPLYSEVAKEVMGPGNDNQWYRVLKQVDAHTYHMATGKRRK